MRARRRFGWFCALVGLAASMHAGPSLANAPAPPDALKSPACLAARERLDAVMAEARPDIVQLRAARQRAARACFREDADTAERPSRLDRPQMPLPAAAPPPPPAVVPAPSPAPAAAAPAPMPAPATVPLPSPNQAARCDAGGCWDIHGQRLNRVGNQLVNPQGQLCTQQGTVLACP